jgi:hypothetical protein
VTALIVPKVLGVVGFGYWQLFIFYTSYVGFFHLGLCDGAYLKLGGISREGIDKQRSNAVFWVSMAYQSLFVLIASAIVWTSSADSDRKLVLFSSALVLILLNSATYLGYIFQALNETKLYSYSIIVDRIVFAALVVVCVVMRLGDFRFYIGAFVMGKLLSLVYCVIKGWDFFCSGLVPYIHIPGYMLQAMNETRLYFYSVIVGRWAFAVLVISCALLHVSDFRLYRILHRWESLSLFTVL